MFIKCILIINEFIENNQGTDDVSPISNFSKVAENNVVLETPQKPPQKLLFETPDPLQQSLSWFKDTGLFLTSNRKNSQEYRKGNKVVRSGIQFTDIEGSVKKHYSVNWSHSKSRFSCKHPAAANFVGMVERNMQEINEEFNKVVLSNFGSNIGKDNEVCFPSYKNKKKT